MMGPLVIIGTGLAGYRLAKAFRAHDDQRELHLISQDDGAYYSKPALSTALRQQKTADDLVMATAKQMRVQLNAHIHTHTNVVAIDVASQSLHLDSGPNLPYGELVLACGAQPIKLPCCDVSAESVLSVNSLTDYRLLRQRLHQPQRVLVVGAGLVGCELANDLVGVGHHVTVCATSDGLLDRCLIKPAAQLLQQQLSTAGVDFVLGQSVLAIDAAETVLSVRTDRGPAIEVDTVISAVGLRPNTALAEAAGIHVNHGIVVDQHGRSSVPNVFALGDCAELGGRVRYYVAPILAGVKAMAQTLAGKEVTISCPPTPVVLKTTVCPVTIAQPTCAGGSWRVVNDGHDFVAHHVLEDQLTGFVLMNGAVKQRMALQQQLAVV